MSARNPDPALALLGLAAMLVGVALGFNRTVARATDDDVRALRTELDAPDAVARLIGGAR